MQPTQLVGFELKGLLGRGGMGTVYRAYQASLERWVALKIIRAGSRDRPEARHRVLREARLAAQLNHASIVQIHQVLERPAYDCIVMELVEGESLDVILRDGRLPIERVLSLIQQVAEGLAAAHAKGIVHRDLKARNIIVTPDERAKILDFGLATRALETDDAQHVESVVVGTLHCMSPEQARGLDVDHRSDLFSLGVLLYRALTGTLPFQDDDPDRVLYKICTQQPVPARTLDARISDELSGLIDRLLEKDRESRPWSAQTVASTLAAAIEPKHQAPGGAARYPRAGRIHDPAGAADGARREHHDHAIDRVGPVDRNQPAILVVDDEEAGLDTFEAAFSRHYTIHRASSARQALDILGREPIELVLADQRMPDLTGVQLLEAVLERDPEVMRILLSGFADIDTSIHAINAGSVYRYVTKPWDEKELKVVIDSALEHHALRRLERRLLDDLEQLAERETSLRRVFQRFAPAAVVDELLATSGTDRFLGEPRVVTMLTASMHDFVARCSHLEPAQLLAFLNRYFERMGHIVARARGSVHRVDRDSLVAVFGAPISSLDTASDALGAAVEMLEAARELERLEADTLRGAAFELCIGLHHGDVIAGNIGSTVRMEYTLVGHPTTVAARIHRRAEEAPGSVLLSQTVLDRLDASIRADTIPFDTVPFDTVPFDTIPLDKIPLDKIPLDARPGDPVDDGGDRLPLYRFVPPNDRR